MKRSDSVQVYDIPAYNKIFPFMMKRRCDSLVYFPTKIDVTDTVEFIHEYNRKHPEVKMKLFYVFCAAMLRTIALRPELNRFIASKRYWQRKELSMNFVVKQNFTDEAPETSTPLYFSPDMTLDEYAKIMDDYINKSRDADSSNDTEDLINLLLHTPYWVVGLIVRLMGLLERIGICPQWLRDADGLHTSLFISNLGSIGLAGLPAIHHLYEWGTTSIFLTMGGLEREKILDANGKKIETRSYISMGATVDERITSGFYYVKSSEIFLDLLQHPEKLMERPVLPPEPMTKKQYRAYLRQMKKQRKAKS